MNRIKIAQIGVCHEHASGKMQALRRLEHLYEIAGFVDDNAFAATPRTAGKTLAPYEGLPQLTLEQVLADGTIQAVTVEVPNNELVPIAMRCMERNLAMHMDKPAGEDLALYRRLLDGCQAKKLPFQMGFMFRNNPAMLFCREAVKKGWLGEIFEFQASMNHNYGGDDYQRYIGQFAGGIQYNLGCHLIDLIVSLLGAPEQVTSFGRSLPGWESSIKNNCTSVLEYPHAIAVIRAASGEINGIDRRRMRVCGTRGSIELCPLERFDGKELELSMTLRDDNESYCAGTHTVACGIVADRYAAQLTELAGIIRGEIADPYTRDHDYLVHKITLAASNYMTWRN